MFWNILNKALDIWASEYSLFTRPSHNLLEVSQGPVDIGMIVIVIRSDNSAHVYAQACFDLYR